jgi:hypothetical protein
VETTAASEIEDREPGAVAQGNEDELGLELGAGEVLEVYFGANVSYCVFSAVAIASSLLG